MTTGAAPKPSARNVAISRVREETAESKKTVLGVLDRHTGTRWADGHRWTATSPERNYMEFTALEKPLYG